MKRPRAHGLLLYRPTMRLLLTGGMDNRTSLSRLKGKSHSFYRHNETTLSVYIYIFSVERSLPYVYKTNQKYEEGEGQGLDQLIDVIDRRLYAHIIALR